MHLASEGAIDPDSLLEISRHLDACDHCARRAAELADVDALAAGMREAISADEHPAMADLTAYAEDEIDEAAREWVEAHLESCVRCREDVADIRAEHESLGGGGWRGWQWIAAGILVLAATGAGTIWLQKRSGLPSSPPGRSSHIQAPHAPASPRPDSFDELERSVLAAGRIEPPTILHTLRPVAQTLRGSETAVVAELHPAGEVVEDDRPAFSWTATPGARYVVMVLANDEPVATSEPLGDTEWRPSRPLRRGTTYSWQVETRRSDGSTTVAPAPPQPEALFRIADADTLAEIDAASRAHPDDHLLLAILYARAGMKTRAVAELDSHLASHPADAQAAALADGIRRW
jgi:hypothetical protein